MPQITDPPLCSVQVRRSRWFADDGSRSFAQDALISRLKQRADIRENRFVMVTLTFGDIDDVVWADLSDEDKVTYCQSCFAYSQEGRLVKRFVDKLADAGFGSCRTLRTDGHYTGAYFCAREFQEREMVHFHLLIPVDPDTLDLDAMRAACKALWKFGDQVSVDGGDEAATAYCSKLATYGAKAFTDGSVPDWIQASEGYRTFRTYSCSRGFLPPLRPVEDRVAPTKWYPLVWDPAGAVYTLGGRKEVPGYRRGFVTIAQYRGTPRSKEYVVTVRQEGCRYARQFRLMHHPALLARPCATINASTYLCSDVSALGTDDEGTFFPLGQAFDLVAPPAPRRSGPRPPPSPN